MFRNYLKIAWRHLLKNRRFTLLNLIGLSTGLAGTLLICLWVYDEGSFDHFHKNDRHLFQVMENVPHEKGITTSPETPALLAATLKANMPEVAAATVSTPPSWFPKIALTAGDKNSKAAGIFAGADYLQVFSYPLLQGNNQQVLQDKNSIVISASLAQTLFGSVSGAVGKTIHWQLDKFKKASIVSGVLENTPANSSTRFDCLLPFDVFREIMNITAMDPQGPFYTYLVTKEGTDVTAFNAKLSQYMTSLTKGSTSSRQLFLERYSDHYLHGNYENGVQAGGRISYVKLFSLISLFILLIACINFVNLSTAQSSGRMKEMGIRKTIGANRATLVLQYLGESMLLTFLSLLVALMLVTLLLPEFNQITGKSLSLSFNTGTVAIILAIALATGLLAGSYPAFYLSGFHPLSVLKGKMPGSPGQLLARKGLVVFQFTLSVLFMVAVITVYRQIAYVQHRYPGYDKDNVVYFDVEGKVPEKIPDFLAGIKRIPGVENASAMVGNVLGAPSRGCSWKGRGKDEIILCRPFQVNYDMMETLGLQMAAGRSFSRDYGTDNNRIIFNEAAIRAMGIENPVGKVIQFDGSQLEIAGVVKDFHFQSMHEAISPAFFRLDMVNSTVMVKIKGEQTKTTLAALNHFYQQYNPGFAFDYKFLDEDYQAQYIAEQRVAALSKYFTILAILISCLGLFGLVAFTAESRRKEISIRKVLGATVANVVLMLSGVFLRSVLIAIGIGLPLAWYGMNRWLHSFVYHMEMGAGVLLLVAGAIIGVTLLTVSFQSVRAALENPVKSLKME
ncbi:ABC transporter permease [Chitinophaga arvensicola]|uniref:FtsX-like permease family protein n=1 Tax=Chitinophaga arvensicola TaxID=29529 RepID=A0A1I0RAV8_9BACT|nr:ABC transporter permease [Chitinophaga arvensicola]SEW37974.1 FtsX-like permease family protein [Chitinophaga arvensicola]